MDFLMVLFWTLILLFILWVGYRLGIKRGELLGEKKFSEKIPKLKQEAIKKSRAVIAGQFSEQLSPYLPDFPFKPTEARFLGKPIDFIVFKGLDEKEPEEIIFVEVKSRDSSLSTVERRIRNLINEKKVSWFEYRIPREMTK